MKTSRILRVLGAVFVATVCHGGELTLNVETQQAELGIGEPIVLHCVFTNHSDRPADVDLGYNQQAIYFVLDRSTQGERKLPIAVHHGGMTVDDHPTLAPNETISRFVVFDQWFQPPARGDYQLEFCLPHHGNEIRAPFTVHVGATDAVHVKAGARMLIDRFAQLQGPWPWDERFNCRCAIELFCTYLPKSFQSVLDELKQDYARDAILCPLIRGAESAGPGLCRILD
jgi:hypothetical protein